MKKFLLGLLIGLLIATPVAALATTNGAIRLIINGVDITPTMDVAPQIIDAFFRHSAYASPSRK